MGVFGDAWNWTKGAATDAWDAVTGAVDDTFSGEQVEAYDPDAAAYTMGGGGAEARAARFDKRGQLGRKQMTERGMALNEQAGGQAGRYERLGAAAQDRGIENSRAQAQLQQGLDQGMAQNMAMARSGRGFGGSASAERQAAANNAVMGQRTNQSAALLRGEEEAAQRAANDRMTRSYAGLGEQARGRGYQAELGLTGQGNQYEAGYAQMGQGVIDTDLAARMQREETKSANEMDARLGRAQIDQQRDAATTGMLGSMAGSAMMAFSDERSKTDIQEASKEDLMKRLNELEQQATVDYDYGGNEDKSGEDLELSRQLDALESVKKTPSYSFRYTDDARELYPELTQPGEQYGVMAQDLERTPAGEDIVSTGPGGMKAVDTREATMTNMAATGELAREQDDLMRRLEELEQQTQASNQRLRSY